ncbi:MAG: primosomal protein N' [Anaerostipes sp.]|nr:primosomal protein N' [Anaerostipes sp.]
MEAMYADIIINISHEALDRVFQYRVPLSLREKINVGQQVIVPFGRGNKQQKGFVVKLGSQSNYDESKIKDMIGIEEQLVSVESKMIQLAYWIRENYGSTMIQALRTVLPVQDKMKQKVKRFLVLELDPVHGPALLEEYFSKHYVAKARLLAELLDCGRISWEIATKKLKIGKSTIDGMERDGILRVESEHYFRNPSKVPIERKEALPLNEKQQEIVDDFICHYRGEQRKTYLLHGITGSGKTEVYLAAIEEMIKEGKQTIVLIPEIALTYQTVKRFTSRFGDRVSILNSKMSKGERYDQWLRAKEGKVDIMIGPRSALFVPFENLGLIIIDEEHEGSYKSEQTPRYHAREVAIEKAAMEHASVILGSATPSIESYQKALDGTYKLWTLKERAKDAVLPEVYIEDLREELKAGNRSMFSRKLYELIQDRLNKKEQIMLFLNRRGFAGFVSCRSCGHVMGCSHCDVSLTYHRGGTLKCHYCGHEEEMPKVCPQCGSKMIGTFGLGTQKVESALLKEFPQAKVLRMDMDTTRKKHSYDEILAAFSNDEADILVGTQMIVKGHDFANVTLVGILAADLSLHSNDYRAGERTFQLLTQAAGRAGRAEKPGEVVIQTYSPDHYSIVTASQQDYEEFYRQEMGYRTMLKYPPVYQMLVVFFASLDEEKCSQMAQRAAEIVKGCKVHFIGPSEATFAKIKDVYRQVLYIKEPEYETLVRMKDRLEEWLEQSELKKDVMVNFDFNPMNSY